MGRSAERVGQQLRLDIKPPALFRCPISLEVMSSPVSLCTGVTYDRSSIQRWLDSGNTTCPATMLPLPTTDLIPNLTLRRLINLWSSSSSSSNNNRGKDEYAPADLVKDLTSPSSNPLPLVDRLLQLFADPDVDDSVKNGIIGIADFANAMVSIILSRHRNGLKTVEAAVEVVSTILNSDWIRNKEAVLSALCADLDATLMSLATVLKQGRKIDSVTNAARVVQAALSAAADQSATSLSPERVDMLVAVIIELIDNSSAVDEGLGCLMELAHSKKAVRTMVQFGVVPALLRILSPTCLQTSCDSAERAILILEAASNCSAGRAAVGELVGDCVRVVMERMMKVGKGGREAAVGVLWGVCCGGGGSGGDRRRAREAVVAVRGGMAKILVVMQGDCSPAVRRMAGDLLRLFPKSLLAGYDTHTTHIMPF